MMVSLFVKEFVCVPMPGYHICTSHLIVSSHIIQYTAIKHLKQILSGILTTRVHLHSLRY